MKICTCTHRFPSLIYYRRRQAFVEWEREREREKEMWIRISRWGAWEEGWIRSSSLITVFKLIGTYNSHSTNACLLLLLLFVRLPSPPLPSGHGWCTVFSLGWWRCCGTGSDGDGFSHGQIWWQRLLSWVDPAVAASLLLSPTPPPQPLLVPSPPLWRPSWPLDGGDSCESDWGNRWWPGCDGERLANASSKLFFFCIRATLKVLVPKSIPLIPPVRCRLENPAPYGVSTVPITICIVVISGV